jgi:hypothetical protein
MLIALLSKTFADAESNAELVLAYERIKMILKLEKSALGFFIGKGSSRYQAPWHKCPHIIEDPEWGAKEKDAKQVLLLALVKALGRPADAVTDGRWQTMSLEEVARKVSPNEAALAVMDEPVRKAWRLAQSGPELFMVLEREEEHSQRSSEHPSEPVPIGAPSPVAPRTIMTGNGSHRGAPTRPHLSPAALDGATELRAGGRIIEISNDELYLLHNLLRKLSCDQVKLTSTEGEANKLRGDSIAVAGQPSATLHLDDVVLKLDGLHKGATQGGALTGICKD